jgi:hypothetical protein
MEYPAFKTKQAVCVNEPSRLSGVSGAERGRTSTMKSAFMMDDHATRLHNWHGSKYPLLNIRTISNPQPEIVTILGVHVSPSPERTASSFSRLVKMDVASSE